MLLYCATKKRLYSTGRGRGKRAGGGRRDGQEGSQKSGFGGPWVGAFSVFRDGVYRNPVHILAQNGLKFGKCVVLGVDVIQPRPTQETTKTGVGWGIG